jgi:DNA-binding transcriptional LysR family regulator
VDRLIVMNTFVTVGKSESFSGAARELGISGSLVSRHVADLEKQIGVRLVHRTARSVSLTEAGREYCTFASRILGEIDGKDQELNHSRDVAEGTLSIISPKWIGTLGLGDALAAFSAAHPKITVRFELGGMSDRTYDFLDRGYDVAFHTRDLRDSSVMLRKLTDLTFVLAASPSYLSKHGRPQELADLSEHACLVHVNDSVWRLGSGRDSVHYKIQDPAHIANSYQLIEKLVTAGCGIGLIPWETAAGSLGNQTLELVLPHMPPPDRALYALHAPGGRTSERVRIFLDFMTKWFRANPSQSL